MADVQEVQSGKNQNNEIGYDEDNLTRHTYYVHPNSKGVQKNNQGSTNDITISKEIVTNYITQVSHIKKRTKMWITK